MERVNYDYSKLRGRIVEKCGTIDRFSQLIGTHRTNVSFKLNNKVDFTQREIAAICNVLDIPLNELSPYFFTPEDVK